MNALDILSGIGTVLDTPRRAAWALPGWLQGGTDPLTAALYPSEAVSGEDVTGDPYTGTALEMLGDPTNLIPGIALLKRMGKASKAKAFNKTAARLLETGGMPEDVAKLTKAVGETGGPVKYYHGTPHAGLETRDLTPFPPARHSDFGDKGTAVYFTENQPYAATYMDTYNPHVGEYFPGKGKVLEAHLDIRNPLNLPRQLRNDMKYGGDIDEYLHHGGSGVFAKQTQHTSDQLREWLLSRGYDSVIDPDEIAVLNKSSIYSPWKAPNPKKVPNLSPSIAALLGYNTARTGGVSAADMLARKQEGY